MLNRVIKLSTIALGIVCAFVVLCTGVFAATRQSSTITTTVQFTPGIIAKVEVSVDNGNSFTTLFNNKDGIAATTGQFVISGTPQNYITETKSSTPIIFRVTNLTTSKNITATLSLVTTNGVYLENENQEILNSIAFKNISEGDANYNSTTITQNGKIGSTEAFHIVSLYENLPITIQVALTTIE